MKIKAIVYDWDGTLCNSIPDGFEGTCRVFESANLPRPDFLEYVEKFGPPFTDFYRERGVQCPEANIWKCYHQHAKHLENEIYEDVRVEIEWQRSRGYAVSLVTGQSKRMLSHLFEVHSCEGLFDHVLAEATPTKTAFFMDACRRMQVDPSETIAIGDFGTDIKYAREAGVIAYGISRDNLADTTTVLLAAGAVHVIRRLSELRTLLA